MPPEVIIVPAVFGIPAAVWVIRMWFHHREKMAGLPRAEQSANVDARLARVEQAVEAIAVEIERIGESQRFLTKVLTDARPGLTEGSDAQSRGRLASH